MSVGVCVFLKATNRQNHEKLLISEGKQQLKEYFPFDISTGMR
jgi:hypothetical protein